MCQDLLRVTVSAILVFVSVNLALRKTASQSSTCNWDGAYKSVDGNRNTNMWQGSCSNTNDDAGGPNWWMVDLGDPYLLNNVVMYNRAPDSCGNCGK